MINIQKLKTQIIKSKLAKDSFWAIFGNVVAKGLSMLAMITIARILGKNDYGEYGIIKSTLSTLAFLSTFGLGYTATKFIAEFKDDQPEYINHIIKLTQKITFIISGSFTVLVFIFADYISEYVFEEPDLVFSLRLAVLFLLFNSLVMTQIGILAGFGEFKALAKINSIVGVYSITCSVLLTYFFGINGALIGLLGIQFLNYFYNSKLISKKKRDFPEGNSTAAFYKKILGFSTPVALQEMAWSILSWFTGLLLVKFSTYSEVGLFSAAMQWNAIILFIPGILRNVILSHMASATSDLRRHGRILKMILLVNFSVTLSISVFVYFFSGFISTFYGSDFDGFQEVVKIAVFTTIFSSMSNVYAQAYMSKNKNWLMLFFRIIRDGSILLIAYSLITQSNGVHGAMDMAKSILLSNIIFLIIMAGYYELRINRRKLEG